MANTDKLTKEWLIGPMGFLTGEKEDELISPNKQFIIRILDFSEELGQHLDFCIKKSDGTLTTVFSAYYLDRQDFLEGEVSAGRNSRTNNNTSTAR